MTLTPEQLQKNFETYSTLLSKTGERAAPIAAFLEQFGERIALAPASSRADFHNSFPGGFCDHSLRVLKNVSKLVKAFEWDVPKESMIIGALFHDLGKIGNEDDELYQPQTDQYKREKWGNLYQYNTTLPHMTVPLRGLYLCQRFGIKLTHDETLCIMLNDGFVVEENREYCLKISPLVFAVQTGDYISTMAEKLDTLGF